MLTNQRAFFRVQYPETARPVLLAVEGDHTYAVMDLSEEGVRLSTVSIDLDELPRVGDRLSGYIRLRSGPVARLAGEVVRVEKGEMALRLKERRISFATVLDEQLFLRARYPTVAAPASGSGTGG